MRTRQVVNALGIAGMVLGFSGCYGCEQLVKPALDRDQLDGAKLSVPATATAGQTITLDASGSEVQSGPENPARCPKMVRFYRRLPSGEWERLASHSVFEVDTTGQYCRAVNTTLPVNAPAASKPGTSVVEYAIDVTKFVDLHALADFPLPLASNAKAKVLVTTPASAVVNPPPGGGGSGSGGSGGPPANRPPVAKFYASVDPSVQGQPIELDARESFDPDGTVTAYDWDYNGDGTYDETRTDGFGHIANAGAPGNRRIILRVHDDKGATAVSAPLDQLVVAPTTFTAGTFGAAGEVAVNTPFDIAVNDNVPGADVISLDTNDDGAFDDGRPAQTAGPGDAKPQFRGMQFAKGGWKRLAVKWHDNGGSNEETITTQLIKVTPFENPAVARAAAAAARTRVSATLTPTSSVPVAVPKVSLNSTGVAVRGLVVRGGLKGKVRATRAGQKLPPGLKALTNADYAASFAGTVPRLPGSYGAPVGQGLLLARARRDPRTMVCLRVVQRSATSTRFTVLGATGRARGLGASGAFPPLLLDSKSRKARSGHVTFTLTKGAPKGLSPGCRALARRLPKRPNVVKLAGGLGDHR